MRKFAIFSPLLIIIILAIGLRLPLLSGSLWLDEAAQALMAARPFSQQHLIVNDFQPPFLHYLLHFIMHVSYQEWWLRLWGALLPSVIVIIATYQLAIRLFDRPVAIVTALLVATNSLHVFFSQELRPYMWSAAWAALSILYLADFLRSPPTKSKFTSSAFIGWVIFSILGLYTSYLYPFVFIGQLIILVWLKNWRAAFIGAGATALAFAPWLPHFLGQLQAGLALGDAMPGWTQVVSFGQIRSVWMTAAKFIYGVSDLELNTFYITSIVLLAITLSATVIFFWRKKSQLTQFQRSSLIFLTATMILPFFTAWLVSFFVPVIQPKRVIFLLPLFYLLVTSVALFAYQKSKFSPAALILPLFLVFNFVSLFNYYTDPLLQRENWRGLQQTIYDTQDPTTTLVLFSYLEPFSPWRWYEDTFDFGADRFSTLTTGTFHIPSDGRWQTRLAPVVTSYQTVLLFDYLRDLTDPQRQLDTFLQDLGFQETGVYDYPNIGFVRIFQLQTATTPAVLLPT